VKARYLQAAVTDTVVTRAVDGYPQRVIRTRMVDRLEQALPGTGLLRAAANALRLRSLTSTSFGALVREGVAMRRGGDLTWAQTAMAANAPMLTRAALVGGNLDAGILPTGQVVGLIDELPSVSELVDRVMAEASETLDRLSRPD
jgi:NAD(P)H-dependent flavin oxidoreductase YrpB (nitropropane dioxygenase family)